MPISTVWSKTVEICLRKIVDDETVLIGERGGVVYAKSKECISLVTHLTVTYVGLPQRLTLF